MQLPRSGTSIKSTATQTEICWGTQDFAVHVLTSMHQRTAPISPSAERHPAYLYSYTGRRNTHPCTDTLVITVWCTRNNHLRCGTLQERSILAGSVRTGLHKKGKTCSEPRCGRDPKAGQLSFRGGARFLGRGGKTCFFVNAHSTHKAMLTNVMSMHKHV